MIAFEVNDMTCGHCASKITKSLRSADHAARVTIDLPKRLVMVEPTEADAQSLREAIADAGYTPVAVEADTIEASVPDGA
ncbi:heavy-metal-associated domain-containing protein [Rhizobacter sp. J219]|uniref:heavy-metal-associated domain-containing protein n=1 Tax=Rhizobacter sp. J219 TaxID=2898430 RepID=UPI00215149B9|nr:heavy-metal-associated domain-containing protein [Rhizobacter sp. J219]MCR5882402.1 heavy-metal-associated domain-containing protein [Rhizobacter sp. J219]